MIRILLSKAIVRTYAAHRAIRMCLRAYAYSGVLLECGPGFSPGAGVEFLSASNIAIGSNFRTGKNVRIHAWPSYAGRVYATEYEALIQIGNNVFFNDNSYVTAAFGIQIGDNCLIGSNVLISDNSHGASVLTPAPRSMEPLVGRGRIVVGENVWICNNCVITSGITIGSNSILAANSVVVRDVPSGSIVGGVPARIIKLLC
jgi:acetyltransferase-like isoleucine patch superfamily enzyme